MIRNFLTVVAGIVLVVLLLGLYDWAVYAAVMHRILPLTIGLSWHVLISGTIVPCALLLAIMWILNRNRVLRRGNYGCLSLVGGILSLFNVIVVGCFYVFNAPGSCT